MISVDSVLLSDELIASLRRLCGATHSMTANDGGVVDGWQAITNAAFFDTVQALLPRLLDEVELMRHMLAHPLPEKTDAPWTMYINTDHGRVAYDPTKCQHVMMMLWFMYKASTDNWSLSWEEWVEWHAGRAVDT